MSSAHPSHSYTSEHARQYDALLHLPWFQLAMERACAVNCEDDLPYVGGSRVGPDEFGRQSSISTAMPTRWSSAKASSPARFDMDELVAGYQAATSIGTRTGWARRPAHLVAGSMGDPAGERVLKFGV